MGEGSGRQTDVCFPFPPERIRPKEPETKGTQILKTDSGFHRCPFFHLVLFLFILFLLFPPSAHTERFRRTSRSFQSGM